MENLNDNFEFGQVRATAEAAKIGADRANRGMRALEMSVKKNRHYVAGSVFVVLVLSMAVIGGGWWVNTRLKAQGTSFSEILGLQADVQKLNNRMSSAEVAISTFPSELQSVSARIDTLDKKSAASRQSANVKPVASAAPEQENQIAQLNDRIATLQAQHNADTMKLESTKLSGWLLWSWRLFAGTAKMNLRPSIVGYCLCDSRALQSGVPGLFRIKRSAQTQRRSGKLLSRAARLSARPESLVSSCSF